MMEAIPLVGVLGSFVMVIVIVLSVTRSRQRRAELQAEVQTKLIERFASAPELAEFLQSPTGRQFVEGVQMGPVKASHDRIAAGIQRAIILGTLGLGFATIRFVDGNDDFIVPAIILIALGVGYLLAAIASVKLTAALTAERRTDASQT